MRKISVKPRRKALNKPYERKILTNGPHDLTNIKKFVIIFKKSSFKFDKYQIFLYNIRGYIYKYVKFLLNICK